MPLTNPFDRLRARDLGLDPDTVDLVEVPEAPKPIQQQPTQSPTPEVLSPMGKIWEKANTPLLNVSPGFIEKTSPGLWMLPKSIREGAAEAGAELTSGMTSPLSIGALAAAPFVPNIAAGVFAGLGAKSLYDTAGQASVDLQTGDTKSATKNIIGSLASLAQMVPGVGLAARKLLPKSPPAVEVLPKTAELPPEIKQITNPKPPLQLTDAPVESTLLPAVRPPMPVGEVLPPTETLPRLNIGMVDSPPPVKPPPIIEPPIIEAAPAKRYLGIPEIDRVEAIGTPQAKTAAGAFRDFFEQYRSNQGKLVNKFGQDVRKEVGINPSQAIKNPLDYIRQDSADVQKVRDWFWAHEDKTPIPTLTPKQEAIKALIQENYKAARQEVLTRPGLAKPILERGSGDVDPLYLSQMPKGSILKTLTQKPGTPEFNRLKNEFIDHQLDKGRATTPEQAEGLFNTFLEPYKSTIGPNRAAKYGPIDEAAGIGIPRAWRNPNTIDVITHYNDRVARRLAYHDTIQSKPGISEAIDAITTNDSAKSVLRQIEGNPIRDNEWAQALSSVVRAVQLGPLTGMKDFVTAQTLGFQHQGSPVQMVKSAVKSIANIRENLSDAWKTGTIRHNMSSLEMGDIELLGALRRFRDIAGDLGTRNAFDQLSRAVNLGQGKVVSLDFHQQFLKGKLGTQGKAWFENFGKDINWRKSKLSDEDILKMASRYVDSVQGTYDPRGLPKLTYEGQFAPILSLSRWSIEKADNFVRHTIYPATQGNYVPLLNSTLGLVLGGAAVQAISELATGRKQKTPTLKEVMAEPTLGGSFYHLAGLASAAGQVGIMGDVLKGVLDKTYGKNRPQEINNILLSAGSDVISEASALFEGVSEEGVSLDLMANFINQVLQDHVQAYRLVWSHIDSEKVDKSNKLRDLRVFNTLKGNNIQDQSGDISKNITGSDLKEFKETTDLGEAEKMLPDLVKEAGAKSDNTEEFAKELDKIKNIPYNTMPSIETDKLNFVDYYNFLVKTQGEEEAKRRVADYAIHHLLNQQKVKALP